MANSFLLESHQVYQGAVLFLPSEDEVKATFEERTQRTMRHRSQEDCAPVTRVINNTKYLHWNPIWGHPILVLSRGPSKTLALSGVQMQEIDFLVVRARRRRLTTLSSTNACDRLPRWVDSLPKNVKTTTKSTMLRCRIISLSQLSQTDLRENIYTTRMDNSPRSERTYAHIQCFVWIGEMLNLGNGART